MNKSCVILSFLSFWLVQWSHFNFYSLLLPFLWTLFDIVVKFTDWTIKVHILFRSDRVFVWWLSPELCTVKASNFKVHGLKSLYFGFQISLIKRTCRTLLTSTPVYKYMTFFYNHSEHIKHSNLFGCICSPKGWQWKWDRNYKSEL